VYQATGGMQNMDAQNAHANPLFVKAYQTTALSYA